MLDMLSSTVDPVASLSAEVTVFDPLNIHVKSSGNV